MTAKPITAILKPVLIFGSLSIGIDIVRLLLQVRLDITKIFYVDFLKYDVALEFVLITISALSTLLATKKIRSAGLGISLLKAVVFAIVYISISFISFIIMRLIYGSEFPMAVNIFNACLKYLPNGLIQGIIFQFVLHHITPKMDGEEV